MERICSKGKYAPLRFRTGQATFIALGSGGDKLFVTEATPRIAPAFFAVCAFGLSD
jgi:hypothetical protein